MKSKRFKAGDIVLCIGMNDDYGNKLETDCIYVVKGHDGASEWVYVMDNDGINSYESKYFIKLDRPKTDV